MNTVAKREVVTPAYRRMAMSLILAVMWIAAFGLAAVAQEPGSSKAAAKHPRAESRARGAGPVSWMPPLVKPALVRLIRSHESNLPSDTVTKVLADNMAELMSGNLAKFLADNVAKLLSGNTAQFLSGNPHSDITLTPLSRNTAELASGNSARLLSGNSAKLFSDIHILSGIHVNVNISMNNSGNTGPRNIGPGPEKIDTTFRKLDRNGDGKISPDEFRAGVSDK